MALHKYSSFPFLSLRWGSWWWCWWYTCIQVPEKVLLSAAHLLLSLLTSVRPAHLYNSTHLQRLYADGITVPGCPQQVCFVLCCLDRQSIVQTHQVKALLPKKCRAAVKSFWFFPMQCTFDDQDLSKSKVHKLNTPRFYSWKASIGQELELDDAVAS